MTWKGCRKCRSPHSEPTTPSMVPRKTNHCKDVDTEVHHRGVCRWAGHRTVDAPSVFLASHRAGHSFLTQSTPGSEGQLMSCTEHHLACIMWSAFFHHCPLKGTFKASVRGLLDSWKPLFPVASSSLPIHAHSLPEMVSLPPLREHPVQIRL